MDPINVLRIKASMPNAHFRVIHSGNPRKTYPLPPYSTVIGLLCNILGNQSKIDEMLRGPLALGILSRHAYVAQEYTWMRNLSSGAHKERYVQINNRSWQEIPEHPGGQSPIKIEVLNEVENLIYVYHPKPSVLEEIRANITAPEKWFSHLHLGRAEDWVMVDSAEKAVLMVSARAEDFKNSSSYYQWMPVPNSTFGLNRYINQELYTELYQKTQGIAVLVTSTYRLNTTPYGKGLIRNFSHIPARLCCASIPFLSSFRLPELFSDQEEGVPVYMAIVASEGGDDCGDSLG